MLCPVCCFCYPHNQRWPPVRYSVTPLLRYSVTPLLRYSVTPLRRYAVTPLRRYAVTPLRRYAVTPLRRYSVTNKVTFLSNDVTDRYFTGIPDRVTEVTFLASYSATFLLFRYSVFLLVL